MNPEGGPQDSVDIAALRVGQRLSHGLFDQEGRLLLASGTLITEQFLGMLRSRGIRRLQTGQNRADDASASKTTSQPKRSASSSDEPADPYALQDRARPGKKRLDPDAFEAASCEAAQHAVALLDHWEDHGQLWLQSARHSAQGSPPSELDAGPVESLLQEVLPVMARDVDLGSVMVGISRVARDTILTHGVRTALCAMHLAQQVGYPPQRIVDAGLTGMFADVGMARLPESLLLAQRPLTPVEWIDVRRHPAYSADLLEHSGVPRDVRIAIYQHHERLDGSGYPHGRKGFFLHPLARLVAVADTYAALSEPRIHRPAQSAYHGVKAVLLGVKAGRLDPTVGKLLVDTVGLFPVGLRVDVGPREKTDAHQTIAARVLRSPENEPDRPVLAVLDDQGETTMQRIDLAVRADWAIAKVYGPEEDPGSSAKAA